MKRIAIVKLSAMGDIIHAMSALQFIKKHNKDLIIDWFVEQAFSKVLQDNPDINNIYEINLKAIKKDKKEIFNQVKLIKEYSKNNYDLVIDAQGLIKSALVSFFLAKNRAGFCKKSTREGIASIFYTDKISIDYDKNVIDRNCFLLSNALKFSISKEDILNKETFLFYKDEDKTIYEYLKKDKKNILLVVGASWDSKMYSKEKFAKIVTSFDENFIIAWGNDKEREVAEFISRNSNAKTLPKIDLNSLKALISKVDLVIGNDTGPTHMAWALNIPSITIFGNTPAYRNTYTTKINKTIKSENEVNPLKLDKNDFSIKNIDEKKIVEMAKELLCIEK
ncbi:lipopolysaccharide heptosyltransferase I [Aliarcobacter thereius]|uniref:lipopolysaccharide heptosyltransferase I n=1 Tax=Aliarcobacter thereius TaxID=544718 RepID=UPI00082455F6|nr:lipopolysaccharide heptosyltransferase I [Aliarcobacter thereius]OCL94150.1 Lipopolysaccharide heptosyltransferase 1 [Aliarcobacter thereius]